jgi:hypothetical protein
MGVSTVRGSLNSVSTLQLLRVVFRLMASKLEAACHRSHPLYYQLSICKCDWLGMHEHASHTRADVSAGWNTLAADARCQLLRASLVNYLADTFDLVLLNPPCNGISSRR